jgi:hypothetical protein
MPLTMLCRRGALDIASGKEVHDSIKQGGCGGLGRAVLGILSDVSLVMPSCRAAPSPFEGTGGGRTEASPPVLEGDGI